MQRSVTQSVLRRTAIKPKVTVIHRPTAQQSTTRTLQRSTPQIQQLTPVQPIPTILDNNLVSNKRIQTPVTVRDRINRNKQEAAPVPRRRIPPKITQIATDLTPDQVEQIRKLKDVGKDQYFVILGNGPSLREIDTHTLSKFDNIKLCTINVPDDRCWPTPYWAFYDRSQYHRHKHLYHNYTGVVFNSTGIKERNEHSIKFKHIPGIGYSRDIGRGVYIGMSSVYATLQIAMYMQFKRIYVLGCDMNVNVDPGQTHFYGVNPDVAPKERMKRFEKEANWYDKMAETLNPEDKVKIVFCSQDVNKWPFMDHFVTVKPQSATDFIIKDTGNAS